MTQARDLADGKFDTDTLVVDAANNRVGVGTTAPGHAVHIVQPTANDTSLTLEQSSVYSWQIGMPASGAALRFMGGGAEKARLLSSGGLTFNGDTAAANALDDYEEGEFTYGFGVTSGSITPRSEYQKGFYTKVGRLVTIQLRFEANSLSSPSGDVYITGFPFASAASTSDRNNSQHYPVMFRELSGVTDFGGGFVTMIANATQARFQYNTHSGGVAGIQGGDIQSDFQGTLNFTYVT